MSNRNTTLGDAFFGSPGDAVDGFTNRVSDSPGTENLRRNLLSRVPGLDWGESWFSASKAVATILELPLAKLLLMALNRYRNLQEFADSDKYPPDQELYLAIDCRKLSTSHNPKLIFTWHGKKVGELEFTVKLTLKLQVLRLVVQAGRIKRIELGNCEGSGAIFLKGEPVVKRNLGELNLPGTIDLDEGWPIPGKDVFVKKESIRQTEVKVAHKPRHFWRRLFLFLFLLLMAGGAYVILHGGINLGILTQRIERLFSQSTYTPYQRPAPYPQPQASPEDPKPGITTRPSDAIIPPAQQRYALVIKTTPLNANVRIEGGNYTGAYKPGLHLPRGEYRIRTSTSGGAVRYDKVTIRNRDVHIQITVSGFH